MLSIARRAVIDRAGAALSNAASLSACQSAGKPDALHTLRAEMWRP